MKVREHALVSLIGAGVLYKLTDSLGVSLWVFIMGVFIDIDHYIDYVRENGISFNPKKVYLACEEGHIYFKKFILFLHSYELILVLWLAIFMLDLGIVWKYAALSFSLHLLLDQMANPVVPFAYFFSFRAVNSFATKKIFITKEVTDAHRSG